MVEAGSAGRQNGVPFSLTIITPTGSRIRWIDPRAVQVEGEIGREAEPLNHPPGEWILAPLT